MSENEWVIGDHFGLPVPADRASLEAGGTAWLNRALQACGSLETGELVEQLLDLRAFEGGGTGAKAALTIRCTGPLGARTKELFVKFSRNFEDPLRDVARQHMEPEVRFALLSRAPGFPITVPRCEFADFHSESGTGILITERLPFGRDGVEPHYRKCADQEVPDAREHYATLVAALARLAGSHKGGRLPVALSCEFPFDAAAAAARDRLPYTQRQLTNRIERYRVFAREFPVMLPEEIRNDDFIDLLLEGAVLFLTHEAKWKKILFGEPDFVALCHWNANVDNAWFWRDHAGELTCGLLDWGSVGQMHLGMSLWGCLSGADWWIWRDHLDELLQLFLDVFVQSGGPSIPFSSFKLHFQLYVAMMGLRWLLDAPPLIRREIGDLGACKGPLDARFTASETARVQLKMLTNFLSFWRDQNLSDVLCRALGLSTSPDRP